MAAQVRHRRSSDGPDWPGVHIDAGDTYSDTSCLNTVPSTSSGQSTLTEAAKSRVFLASWVSEECQASEVEDFHATQTALLEAMKRSASARAELGAPPLQFPGAGATVDHDAETERRTPAPPSMPKPSTGSGRRTPLLSRCSSNDDLLLSSSTNSSPQRPHSSGRFSDVDADLDGNGEVQWARGERSCPGMVERSPEPAPSPEPGTSPRQSGGILKGYKARSKSTPTHAYRTDETQGDVAGAMPASRSPSLHLSGADGGGFGGGGSPQGWTSGYGYGYREGGDGTEAQAKAVSAMRNKTFGEQRARKKSSDPMYQRSISFHHPARSVTETGWSAAEDRRRRRGDVLVSGRDTVWVPSPGAPLTNAKMLLTLQRMTKQIDELTSALEGERLREDGEEGSLHSTPTTPTNSEEEQTPKPWLHEGLREGGLESARRTSRQLRVSIDSFASHLRQLDAREQSRRVEVASLRDDLAACAALVHERDIRLAAVRSAKKECEKTISQQQELLRELAERGTVLYDS